MNSKLTKILEDKENAILKEKPQFSLNNSRSFGTEITKNFLRPLDPDTSDSHNPQRLGDYAKEIFSYLNSIESQYLPQYGYMKFQTDINEKMRGILLDWLVGVHLKFKLLPETLFLCANLIDRYLEKTSILRGKLQLLGVAAMLIASKYEEIYPPSVKDFVYITDNTYTKEEVLWMEREILKKLNFNITIVSPLKFIERYARVSEMNERAYCLARYMIELSIIDYKSMRYKPSMIAASAVYLANKILNSDYIWPQSLINNTPYIENELKPCARDLCILLQGAERSPLQAIKKKYSLQSYFEVSQIVIVMGPHVNSNK
ncbi:unnamed protein product [Blepharisma stoltei]|uniref:Cyclin N-terminal domain-containing protein n=1 Tax=Blepharisma stoltei TaxID=1481888 RepID=A0AAU9JM00_9CILI|nr:unnamed protein product [Blepharisma stoltei]